MRARRFVWAAIALVFALAVFDRESGLPGWLRLRSELAVARTRTDALSEQIAALRIEIAALEHDSFAIERAIREDLELARPGETVVRFENGDDARDFY